MGVCLWTTEWGWSRFGQREPQTRHRLDSLTNPAGSPGAEIAFGGSCTGQQRPGSRPLLCSVIGSGLSGMGRNRSWEQLRAAQVNAGSFVKGRAEWHPSTAAPGICRRMGCSSLLWKVRGVIICLTLLLHCYPLQDYLPLSSKCPWFTRSVWFSQHGIASCP